MDKYRLHKTDSSFEARRFRAWELKQQGWKQSVIAQALGVTPGAVSQWLKHAREEGSESLRCRPGSGPPPRLSAAQRAQLPQLLARGAEAYGFRGALWTRARVAEVIQREFGVRYDLSPVGRILRACGWSARRSGPSEPLYAYPTRLWLESAEDRVGYNDAARQATG